MLEVIERLKSAIPHLVCGFEEAKYDGTPTLVIASRNEDGSGKMQVTMNEPEEFLRDLCTLIGIEYEPTTQQIAEYRASALLARWGL